MQEQQLQIVTPQDFLMKRYTFIEFVRSDIELGMLTFIDVLNGKEETAATKTLAALRLIRNLGRYLELISNLDQLTQNFWQFLDAAHRKAYTVAILKYYNLYFYINNLLNYSLDMYEVPDDWLRANFLIPKMYPVYREKFHETYRQELYLGQTFVSMWRAILKLPAGNEKDKRITNTLNQYQLFIKQVKSNTIKIHLYMYYFLIINDVQVKRVMDTTNTSLQFDETFLNTMLSLVSGKLYEDDYKLFFYFANATRAFNQLMAVSAKINPKKQNIPLKTPCVVNIKNHQAVLDKHIECYQATKLNEVVHYLRPLLNKLSYKRYMYEKIFQTSEIIKNLIILCRGLFKLIIENMNSLLARTNITEHWQLQLDSNKFKKSILDTIMQLELLAPKANNQRYGYISDELLSELDRTVTAITALENERTVRENLSNMFTSEKAHGKKVKRFSKEKKLREDYVNSKESTPSGDNKNPNKSKHVNNFEKQSQKAYQQFIAGNIKGALTIYERILKELPPEEINSSVNILICIGDIYKTSNKEQPYDITNPLLKTAYEYYQRALTIAQASLIANRENSTTDVAVELLYEIAKDLAESIAPPVAAENNRPFENTADQVQDKEIATFTAIERKPEPIKAVFVNQKMALPDFFNKIRKCLEAKGIYLLVVGGYVKASWSQQKFHDIDVVLFHTKQKVFGNVLITDAHQTLIKEFERCELRSKHHPIIYIEYKGTIIELSAMSLDIQKVEWPLNLSDQALINLIHPDAMQRDLTHNAIYYDVANERYIDFFDGINDILQNRLALVQSSDKTFETDPSRVYRVLRSIISQSIAKSFCNYGPQLVSTLLTHVDLIYTLNKNKCYSEVEKLLFRGQAVATWKFLEEHDLQHKLLLLPSNEGPLTLNHSLMVNILFTRLDRSINKKKDAQNQSKALIFATLLWPYFQHALTTMPPNESVKLYDVSHIATSILAHPSLVYILPKEILSEARQIWLVYISTNKILPLNTLVYSFEQFRLAKEFGELITSAMDRTPAKIATTNHHEQSKFFKNDYRHILRTLIKDFPFEYSNSKNNFVISLPKNFCISPKDKKELFKNLKFYLGACLGHHEMRYFINEYSVAVQAKSFYRERSANEFMTFLFSTEVVKETFQEQNRTH